jgi:hypothetical protein
MSVEFLAVLPCLHSYYHFLAEWLPALSMTLCEQFGEPGRPIKCQCGRITLQLTDSCLPIVCAGHCDYEARESLHIIDVQAKPRTCNHREMYPAFMREAVACVSAHPLRHISGASLGSQLTHVQTAWLGLGPRCRGIPPGCYQAGSGRLPLTPQLTASLRQLLAKCLGVKLETTAPLCPVQVLVLDRPYSSNR